MQVVLTKRVPKLGMEHDVVSVKPGFARNFLLPRGLATLATAGALKGAEKRREAMMKKAAERTAQAKELIAKLVGLTLTFKKKTRGDKLYGAIHEKDIVEAVKDAAKIELEKNMVKFKQPIKTVGSFEVVLRLAEGAETTVKVVVEQE